MKLQLDLLLLITLFCLANFAQAKDAAINDNPLTAEIADSQILVTPGSASEMKIRLKLAEGYHAYLERFKFAVVEPNEVTVQSFEVSPTVKFMDVVSKSMKDGIKDRAVLRAQIMVPQDLGSGVTELKLALTYQACREEHCLFPKTIQLTTRLNTSGIKGAEATRSEKKTQFVMAMEKGTLSALLLAFLVGLATSLTPCIYPMIPITLAVLGARKSQSHFRGFLLALVYVFGIALTYSILGVVAASTGGAFGRALGNIWTISAIATVFTTMGLSMYGLIEIQMPQSIQTRFGFAHKTSGFFGAFTAGLVAGVIASPCVGPVLISILTYIAQTQNLTFGFMFLFVFAFGIGFPFLILGTFSQLISHLPKAGPWMELVKFVFGSLMIGMAFYYVHPLYPQWLFNVLLGLALVFVASLYGAFETVGNAPVDPEASITKGALARFRKGLMLTVFVTGAGFFVHGVMSKAGVRFAASTDSPQLAVPVKKDELQFEKFSMDKLYVAQKNKKPVLIDFFAEWCAACKELEDKTFTNSVVRELGDQFTLLRFDATEDTPEVKAILREFNVIGLPTLVFFDRRGKQRDDERVTGFEEAEQFQRRMREILK